VWVVQCAFFLISVQHMGATKVGLVMGSNSDWDVMQAASELLEQFGIDFESRVVSAHRTPDLLFEYASTARERGQVV